ncbi:MAG: T9SS type A sorting domain-containing protein [Saprospiraceae bacterium]|nr:T9SS type A sorting domain-containing protein [Saprospiraceae bacterium]
MHLPENAGVFHEISIFDVQGKIIRSQLFSAETTLNLQGLQPGMYLLKILVNDRLYTGRFVKQ